MEEAKRSNRVGHSLCASCENISLAIQKRPGLTFILLSPESESRPLGPLRQSLATHCTEMSHLSRSPLFSGGGGDRNGAINICQQTVDILSPPTTIYVVRRMPSCFVGPAIPQGAPPRQGSKFCISSSSWSCTLHWSSSDVTCSVAVACASPCMYGGDG